MAGNTEPIAGHGALVAITLDPDVSVFTTVPELFCQIDWGHDHDTADVTPHNKVVDVHIVSPVMKRPERTLTLNFEHGNPVHAKLQEFSLPNADSTLTKIGMRFTAPGETQGSAVDEIIESGFIKSFKVGHPLGANARKVDIIWRATGAMLIDGELFDEV